MSVGNGYVCISIHNLEEGDQERCCFSSVLNNSEVDDPLKILSDMVDCRQSMTRKARLLFAASAPLCQRIRQCKLVAFFFYICVGPIQR